MKKCRAALPCSRCMLLDPFTPPNGTCGSVAAVAVVWAQTDDGIQGFLVPRGTKGFSAPEIHKKLSLRASVTSELVLDDVRLPDSARLPEAGSLKGPRRPRRRS